MLFKKNYNLYYGNICERNIKIRRNTISKSKSLKEPYNIKEIKTIFSEMLMDLTKRLNLYNYKTSYIRVHIIYRNKAIKTNRFSITLKGYTKKYSVLLRETLPIVISNINQDIAIEKIGISFEKLVPTKMMTLKTLWSKESFLKTALQN